MADEKDKKEKEQDNKDDVEGGTLLGDFDIPDSGGDSDAAEDKGESQALSDADAESEDASASDSASEGASEGEGAGDSAEDSEGGASFDEEASEIESPDALSADTSDTSDTSEAPAAPADNDTSTLAQEAAETIAVSTLSTAPPGFVITRQIGIVQTALLLQSQGIEKLNLQAGIQDITHKIKAEAVQLEGNAVLGLQVNVVPLGQLYPDSVWITATGTCVNMRRRGRAAGKKAASKTTFAGGGAL